ncbi:hypothetical protein EZJ19_08755 [Parasulfuritortus cantonensis]|uniref:PI3K/PI4K catalytic domain-containing protein n=1 Tax=Parasulfuritortus cantonensis TaxID=2528202 RepID=A0A4R1BD25_9PROT|nr:hypothetical protein [Parasulfuritortus cantonensis]TCJ14959.1 hypothetical protein EZJ19_08755 [Parasulfuritortus cantonensis]
MSVPILDSSAWREYRGRPASLGANGTAHLAKIADGTGKLRDCFVKLLPLTYPSLLGEAIGWLLARASGLTCVPFAAIVIVPLSQLRQSTTLPLELNGIDYCPAWCCEVVAGKSLRQIHTWAFWLARRQCLHSKDARQIASFDVWTDLRDRNYGNVIRSANGGYIAIDHETILHDLLWPRTGKVFHSRSLLSEARKHLSYGDFRRFQVDMANAASKHAPGFNSVRTDIADIVTKIYPHLSATLTTEVLKTLDERAQAGWLANTLGVIA